VVFCFPQIIIEIKCSRDEKFIPLMRNAVKHATGSPSGITKENKPFQSKLFYSRLIKCPNPNKPSLIEKEEKVHHPNIVAQNCPIFQNDLDDDCNE
jgi:hypothetical protein